MESEFIVVVPVEGFRVLNDATMLEVSKDGTRVRKSAYWDRLIAEGSVKEKAAPKPEVKPEPKPEPAVKKQKPDAVESEAK